MCRILYPRQLRRLGENCFGTAISRFIARPIQHRSSQTIIRTRCHCHLLPRTIHAALPQFSANATPRFINVREIVKEIDPEQVHQKLGRQFRVKYEVRCREAHFT